MTRRPKKWLFPNRLEAVPCNLTAKAVVPGMENIRYWMDGDLEPFVQVANAAFERERKYLGLSEHGERLPAIAGLAVSGGGDNGAFGVGLLVGPSLATAPSLSMSRELAQAR